MHIPGASNAIAGAAINSASKKAVATASAAKPVQAPADQVTLSQTAKNLAANIKPDTTSATNSGSIVSIENSISSGSYSIIGTAMSGHLVTLFID